MRRRGLLALLPTLLLGAQAQPDERSLQALADLLDTPVIAASKYEQPLLESPQATEVLSGEALRAMGVMRLVDALKLMTSVDLLDYEAGTPVMAVRGALPQGAPRALQILVDGVPMYSAEWGGANPDNLPVPLELIDRVEVVRGPSSALYGDNAVTGVLAITTLRPREGWSASARVARGSWRTSRWGASASFGRGALGLTAGLSGNAFGPTGAPSQFIASGSPRTLDDDRGHQGTGFLRAQWSRDGATLWLAHGESAKTFSVSHDDIAIPGIPFAPFFKDRNRFTQAGWAQAWNADFRSELRLVQGGTEQVQGTSLGLAAVLQDPGYADPKGYGVDHYGFDLAELQLNWAPSPAFTFVGGADHRRDRSRKAPAIGLREDDQERTSGAFADLRWAPRPDWALDLGDRLERATLGGSRDSPRVVLSWFPSARSALRAGWYKSTRNPVVLESRLDITFLVSGPPTNAQARIYPNGGLVPETTASWELGWRQAFGAFTADLTLFRMRFGHLITQAPVPPPAPPPLVVSANTFVNRGDATDDGAELALGWTPLTGLALGLNATWLDFTGPDGQRASYAPPFKANLWTRFDRGPFSGYLAWRHVARMNMEVQPLVVSTVRRLPRDPVDQLDGQVAWAFRPHWRLGLYARNAARELTDEGGMGFLRINLLMPSRREVGLSLGWRVP